MKYLLALCLIAAIAVIRVASERAEKICEPGLVIQGICGPCTCNDKGTEEKCENISCLPNSQDEYSTGRRIVRAANGRCIPGQMFQMDCNTCVCPESGIAANAACTLMACPPSGPSRQYRRYYPRYNRW